MRVLKENCNPHERPLDTIDCNNFPCPNWVYGDWGVCNSDCVQMRQVSCEDHTGNFMKDHSCDEKKKPAVIQRCTQCRHRPVVKENRRITNPVYVWKVGKWKQVSTLNFPTSFHIFIMLADTHTVQHGMRPGHETSTGLLSRHSDERHGGGQCMQPATQAEGHSAVRAVSMCARLDPKQLVASEFT